MTKFLVRRIDDPTRTELVHIHGSGYVHPGLYIKLMVVNGGCHWAIVPNDTHDVTRVLEERCDLLLRTVKLDYYSRVEIKPRLRQMLRRVVLFFFAGHMRRRGVYFG